MLRWTAAGAVSTPATVQVRVQHRYPGRIQAGAPQPTRSLSPAELRDNILHFTIGLRTPRTTPCTTLVLSGIGVASRPDTPAAIDLGRQEGIDAVVLHAGTEDLPGLDVARLAGRLDRLVVPVRPDRLDDAARVIAEATRAGIAVSANVVLSEAALPRLRELAATLASACPQHVVLTYPFPAGQDRPTPRPAAVAAALAAALPILDAAGLAVSIKGLPACYLGAQAHRLRRTGNRWYVDADHQQQDALLFFPGVVSFYKGESCRFCSADTSCDGFFTRYLRRGFPPLEPLRR